MLLLARPYGARLLDKWIEDKAEALLLARPYGARLLTTEEAANYLGYY